jgi:hypothetical protein
MAKEKKVQPIRPGKPASAGARKAAKGRTYDGRTTYWISGDDEFKASY